jgi:NTE family protein
MVAIVKKLLLLSIISIFYGDVLAGTVQARHKVGLVLSGGGARGAAHLGVIKVLEKNHIPIDAIVGTSMGALIGGLYASGKSTTEIENLLLSTPWKKIISHDYKRKDIPFRRKSVERDFATDTKMGINSDNEVAFAPGLFKKHGMLHFLQNQTYDVHTVKSFDDLSIPFRAVASRLEDGESVVLSKGSLAEAMYASLAIPGAFAPINIEGNALVDGGVINNLPIDVMREQMDVDTIIVVDISTPYDKNASYNGYLAVTSQLINILMRKNVELSLASMKNKSNEILLTPNLDGYTPLDIEKYSEIMKIGMNTTIEALQDKLAGLIVKENKYYVEKEKTPSKDEFIEPVIDKIEIVNPTYLNNDKILSYLHVKLGEPLDIQRLDRDILKIYSLMIFDDVNYHIEENNGMYTLKIVTTPNWNVNGQLKASFGFEDNMQGHSDYFVKLEYIKFGLNSYAGEWRSQLGLGVETLALTELYQPLDYKGTFYIQPSLFYRDKKVYVSPVILGGHSVDAALDKTIAIQAKEYGASLEVGMNLSSDLQMNFETTYKKVEPSTDILSSGEEGVSFITSRETASILQGKLSIIYDSLDEPFFPKYGSHAQAWVSANQQTNSSALLSPDVDYKQYFAEYTGVISKDKHTLIGTAKAGETFSVKGNFDDVQDFSSFYTLGGLFSLSGLPSNAVTGNNVAFASLVYRYRVSEEDFFGSFSMPLYLGFSAEVGETWYENEDFSSDKLLYAGSVYLAVNTILGPFYLGFGTTEFDYYSVHLSLGKSF